MVRPRKKETSVSRTPKDTTERLVSFSFFQGEPMGRRSNLKQKQQVVFDLQAEKEARQIGVPKKRFTIHDLKHVSPLNETQRQVFVEWMENEKNLLLTGWPGTGKTFLGLYAILSQFLLNRQDYKKILIVRSIVPVRDLGFLPGELEEKTAVYEAPYKQIFDELFPWSKSYENMKEQELVEFIPTSFIRGTTWKDTLILIDEFQNMTFNELWGVLTRVGEGSRVVLCGDMHQKDLGRGETSCYGEILSLVKKMSTIANVEFSSSDLVVRSAFVRELVQARYG